MSKWHALSVLNALALIALVFTVARTGNTIEPAARQTTAYERVRESGVLRCSYTLWPSYVEMDPNTGELSGLWVDYLDAIGALLRLKIDWVEEVPIADIADSLATGRSDAYCGGLWQNASRGDRVDYAMPITYQGIIAVVRADDTRFDADIFVANDPAIRIAAIDGETASYIYRDQFNRAELVGLPASTDVSQLLLTIKTGKADMTFTSPETVARFLEGNPGALKVLNADQPMRVFAESLAVKAGEERLLKLLDLATQDILNSGAIDRLLARHERFKNSFYRVVKPYQAFSR